MVKQIISSALALSMVFGAAAYLPQDIFSADTAIVASAKTAKSGKCGEHVKWTLDSNGTLTISGTGATMDTTTEGSSPLSKNNIPGVKRIVVKEGITSIGRYLIRGTDASSITLPKSLKVIEDGAFQNNEKLTSITIPDGITDIGSYTFYGCKKLKTIKLPKSVTHIGTNSFYDTKWLKNKLKKSPLVVINGILVDGSNAKGKVTLPKSVKGIADGAFWGNENITSITVKGKVKEIGESTFCDCKKLKTVKLPKSVKDIDEYAFQGTKWLDTQIKKKKFVILNGILLGTNEKLSGKVTIPKSVKKIANFNGSERKVTSVTIPNGVTEIGYGAFIGCPALKKINIPKTVTKIGYMAFNMTEWLENKQKKNSLIIENGILISGKTAKGKVVIPKTVKTLAEGAFGAGLQIDMPNENLTSIVIPGSIDTIPRAGVCGCTSLKTIKIKNGVKKIEEEAFLWDPALTSIIIPKSVKEIGKYAIGYSFEGIGSGVWLKTHGHNFINSDSGTPIEPVISCTKGSAALKYAKANNISYVITNKAVSVKIKDQKYTGKALKPAVTVKVGKTTLKKGTDYTVTYKNNKKAGRATATIKLKGKYTGKIVKSFNITK